jgi:hypothetical protein
MKSVKKSNFGDLVKYITDVQNKNERVGYVFVTNCQTDKPDIAITEILNTQAQNRRATSDKTYHLIVSFRAGEQVDDAILQAIEARICEGLGYGAHQRVSAVHHDTDNLHIHIAINKIHPTRYTIHDPYNDHKMLGQLCEKLELEFGLEPDNHRARKRGAENRAADMERHAGIESLLGWIKRECHDQIQRAQSWAELHQVMRMNGLTLHERGNGLVVTAGDGTTVKASSIGREYSKGKLEARFGPFEPPFGDPIGEVPAKKYVQKPMRSRVNTAELYTRYQNEQRQTHSQRADEWARAVDRKNRLIEAAKRRGRLKRAAIKLIKGPRLGKRMMYGATSMSLKDEIQKINKQYLEERQEIHEKYRRRTWADWLRAEATKGDQEALGALRAREAAQGLKGNTVTGQSGKKPVKRDPGQDSITKKGTIIYRLGPTAVRDDGDRLSVSRGATQDGLQAALRMAMERYGGRIAVNGTATFKEQIAQAAVAAKLPITFDDAALERRRQDLLKSATIEEKTHEHSAATANIGRAGRDRHGGRELPSASDHPFDRTSTGRTRPAATRTTVPAKPDIGRIGQKPPPESQHRLRALSELGVVRIAGRSEVLLPSDVRRDLEQQGAQSDYRLRWNVSGAGVAAPALAAADKYIAEREATRLKIPDIPKHTRASFVNGEAATFAGIRHVDGFALALLKRGDDIMVMPIDDAAAAARRLGRVRVGEEVTVQPTGLIKRKGRSR